MKKAITIVAVIVILGVAGWILFKTYQRYAGPPTMIKTPTSNVIGQPPAGGAPAGGGAAAGGGN